MSSTGLNAAQMLMNFTSNVRTKISHKISSKAFAHELNRLQQDHPAPPPHVRHSSDDASPSSQRRAGEVLPGKQTPEEYAPEREETSDSSPSPVRKPGKAERIKSQALSQQKAQDSLYITNVPALERIMAQLKVPAEAIQTCQGVGDRRGQIPFKSVRSLLISQAAKSVPGAQGAASASDVMELLSSLRQAQQGTSLPIPEMNTKTNGLYSLEELDELLTSVVRKVAENQQQNAPLSEQKSCAVPVPDLNSASTDIEPSVLPKGQLERLASQRVPSFLKVDAADSDGDQEPSGGFVWDDASASATPAGYKNTAVEEQPVEKLLRAKPVGESVRREGAHPSEQHFQRPLDSAVDEPRESLKADAGSVSDETAPGLGRQEASRPELFNGASAAKVVDHHFAPEEEDPSAQGVSRAGAGLQATRPAVVEKQSGETGAVDGTLSTRERSERVQGLEGHGASAPGSGMEEGGREGETGGPLRFADSGRQNLTEALKGADGTLTGFDKVLRGGEWSSPLQQAALRESAEPGQSLYLGGTLWPDELSKKIQESHAQGRSHLTLELEPANLGKIILRIDADHNHVTAYVSTQSEEAKNLLLHGSSSLRQHLQEQGLTLGQFMVDVGQRDGGQRFAQTRSNRNRAKGGSGAGHVEVSEPTGSRNVQRLANPDRLISVFA